MDSVESFIWLKKKRLFNKCVKYSKVLKPIFTECMDAVNTDVLIIGDTGFEKKQIAPIYAGACFLAARSLKINTRLVMQKPKKKGDFASQQVKSAIKNIRPGSALIMSVSGRLGALFASGKSYKRFCKERRLRYATTPSLGSMKTSKINRLISAITVDQRKLKHDHQRLKKLIDYGKVMQITTKAGTNIKIGISGCRAVASDGYYLKHGLGGNLPAGEVFVAPAKKKVEGKVVVDASSRNRHSTALIRRKPITITIKNGEVVDISGGKAAKMLQESIDWTEKTAKYDWGIRRIGEIGIGLNPNAKISGSMIIDEKVRGTAHVAIGSNHWFGGTVYAAIHLDQVFKRPRITIDGKLVRI
ncbi:MAG: hypothetical protein MAG795_00334 [Candidatus Woesearchaeota archaeon]|nr:hypothetical protein [Candidatus Woesearchaeota archaeon]